MKQRLREGAKLIVADPRRIDLVRSPHVEADYHLQLKPERTWRSSTRWHTCGDRGSGRPGLRGRRCEGFDEWAEFISRPENSPEAVEPITGVPAEDVRAAARLYAQGGNGAIYYGLGVTEHSQARRW